MIIPHKIAEPRHNVGLEIPMADYLSLIYNAKTWKLTADVTHTRDDESRRTELVGVYHSQFFTGPGFLSPDLSDEAYKIFEAKWMPRRRTTETRFKVHDYELGSNPLVTVDPAQFAGIAQPSGKRTKLAWMHWYGSGSGSVTHTSAGLSSSTPVTFRDLFVLSAFGRPLPWKKTATENELVDGVRFSASAAPQNLVVYFPNTYGSGGATIANGALGNYRYTGSEDVPSSTVNAQIVGRKSYRVTEAGYGLASFWGGGSTLSGTVKLEVTSWWTP
jgi:hypothetical protein